MVMELNANAVDSERRSENKVPKFGVRHIQVILTFVGFSIAYGLRVNLSVAIVAMTNNATNQNGTFEVFPWNEEIKGSILSSFFWGYLVFQIPSGALSEKYGAKYIFTVGMLICSIATLLTPFVARNFDYIGVLVIRVIQGLGQSCLLPSINSLISKWVTPEERNRCYSIVLSGPNAGTLLMLPTAGLLAASSGGWPSIFYISGGVAFLWVIVWLWFGASSPIEHPYITQAEKEFIEHSLIAHTSFKKNIDIPWKKILTSIPMYGIMVAHLGQNWCFWIILTQIPNYINSVLGFNIASNGFLSALPQLAAWIFVFVFSYLADYVRKTGYFSKTAERRLWNSIAFWISSIMFMTLALVDYRNTIFPISLIVILMAANGGILNGFLTNHVALSPNFCGTLMGITNAVANLTSIGAPLCVGFIVSDKTSRKQWNLVFAISSVVLFICNLVYVLLTSGEVQSWNYIEEKTDEEKKS